MTEFKNLDGKAGIEKMRTMIKSQNICLFTTELDQHPLSTRPMGTQEADEEGRLWFISRKDSEKNLEIKDNDKVQLFYSNNGSSEYLSVYGKADIYTDQDKIEEHWSAFAKAWFHDGKRDPAVSLICVTPEDVHYWDTKNNKAITLLKIAAGALTGHDYNVGVEGKIAR